MLKIFIGFYFIIAGLVNFIEWPAARTGHLKVIIDMEIELLAKPVKGMSIPYTCTCFDHGVMDSSMTIYLPINSLEP